MKNDVLIWFFRFTSLLHQLSVMNEFHVTWHFSSRILVTESSGLFWEERLLHLGRLKVLWAKPYERKTKTFVEHIGADTLQHSWSTKPLIMWRPEYNTHVSVFYLLTVCRFVRCMIWQIWMSLLHAVLEYYAGKTDAVFPTFMWAHIQQYGAVQMAGKVGHHWNTRLTNYFTPSLVYTIACTIRLSRQYITKLFGRDNLLQYWSSARVLWWKQP